MLSQKTHTERVFFRERKPVRGFETERQRESWGHGWFKRIRFHWCGEDPSWWEGSFFSLSLSLFLHCLKFNLCFFFFSGFLVLCFAMLCYAVLCCIWMSLWLEEICWKWNGNWYLWMFLLFSFSFSFFQFLFIERFDFGVLQVWKCYIQNLGNHYSLDLFLLPLWWYWLILIIFMI